MDLGLQDRVYVVTGASRGLGLATATVLAAEGARVLMCARDEAALQKATESLAAGDRSMALPGDLTDTALGERLAAGETLSLSDDAWRASFESVFLGALRIARAAIAVMGEEGGSLAFVLSTSVKQPIAGLAASNGLRPGLAMLAKTMADELGPRNIRVNGLLPGRIDTDRVRELDGSGAKGRKARAESEARIPLGRYGEAAEFGRVAAFLLSPAASFVSGTMVPVDGGMMRTI